MPHNYEFALMNKEVSNYHAFVERHKECDPETREAIIEETVSPTLSEVILHMTSIGMCPLAKCCVCGQTESIACDERIDSA